MLLVVILLSFLETEDSSPVDETLHKLMIELTIMIEVLLDWDSCLLLTQLLLNVSFHVIIILLLLLLRESSRDLSLMNSYRISPCVNPRSSSSPTWLRVLATLKRDELAVCISVNIVTYFKKPFFLSYRSNGITILGPYVPLLSWVANIRSSMCWPSKSTCYCCVVFWFC